MKSKENSVVKLLSQITFKMGKKLGEGRFSIVKLGTHSLTNQPVAIKILDKTKISNIQDKERINREIKIMKKINHFNITKLYTIIETKCIIYLVEEYVQGKELNDYLYTKGKLSEQEACKFFHQIISGLSYLHYIGIAHRDFKPENILLTSDNKILKIIDFGLSNMYKKDQLLKTSCGSPCYIPPEMIKEEVYNGDKSDIWSAGVILYLMLCGHLPFYEEDNQLMYDKIIKGEFNVPEFLSDEAKDIIKKILEVDPKKRLNFEEIKSHPWFNIIDKKYMMYKGMDIENDIIPIDEDIVEEMEKFGINKIETRYHVLKNYHNKITTIYNILLKKKIDSGKKSISDLQSDLFNKYMDNKINRIKYYGNLDSVLKHRIGNNNKITPILPNWPENEYETDAENMIIGDSGSVMERLIKAGKFVFDEENMCVNKVTNNNKIHKKKDNIENEGDNKYKTISSIKTNSNRKIIKIGIEKQEKEKPKIKNNHKTYFKYENENEKNKELNNNLLDLQNAKIEKKNKKTEEEDWYKEMEKLIDEEKINNNKKITKKHIIIQRNNNKQIRPSMTQKVTKNKNDELKVSYFYLDKENKENKKIKTKILSPSTNKTSNIQLKKPPKNKVNNALMATKKYETSKINTTTNNTKIKKIIKKKEKINQDIKGNNKKKERKSFIKNIEKDNENILEGIGKRRNQSFHKRYKNIKI